MIIKVGMGEMKISYPPAVLSAVGIGSCVAVILLDVCENKAGGMAHIMLPWLPKSPREGANLYKYADYAIEQMIGRILQEGAQKENLGAKIVGGSHMFEASKSSYPMEIGSRNLEAVRQKLESMNVPIIAQDTGGNFGRSVELQLESGLVSVRSAKKGSWTL